MGAKLEHSRALVDVRLLGSDAARPRAAHRHVASAADEDGELARALAESAALAGVPAASAPALGAQRSIDDTDRMLSMAQTTKAVVAAPALRVAGDSRGTASTLVGLT